MEFIKNHKLKKEKAFTHYFTVDIQQFLLDMPDYMSVLNIWLAIAPPMAEKEKSLQ